MEKERRLAGTLTRPNRLVDLVLAGRDFDEATINEAARWGNRLEASVQRWKVGRLDLHGANQRLGKIDAARKLRFELGRLKGGDS